MPPVGPSFPAHADLSAATDRNALTPAPDRARRLVAAKQVRFEMEAQIFRL